MGNLFPSVKQIVTAKLLETCSPNFQSFFKWSQEYLKKHGKICKISNTKSVKSGDGKCGGWCNEDEIRVAFNNPLFEPVYVHEFSHMQQNVEKSPLWDSYSSQFWWDMRDKKITLDSWDSLFSVIALEHDCESRVIEHSKKWNLFDNAEYARKANLYLHYHQYLFLRGKWITSTSIYHPILIRMMGGEIKDISEFKKIDIDMMKNFDEILYKGR